MKIIFLSNQLFDFPLKTNKWHVATRIAKLGHDVLFVDPPIRFRKLIRQIFQGRWPLRRLLTSSGRISVISDEDATEMGQIPASLASLELRRSGPAGGPLLAVFTPLSLSVSEAPNLTDFNIRRMKSQFPEFFDGGAIIWVYNPAMDEYIEKIPHHLLVYDCVDDYPSMANYVRLGLSEQIAKKEEKVARKANIVFATTESLAKKLSTDTKNVHYVGNAGDYERFSPVGESRLNFLRGEGVMKERTLAPELADIPHPRIGFTGAIDEYKLNLPLLVKVAKAYPEYSLIIVGPQGVADDQPDLSKLKKLSNVYFIGQRPYEEMPSFFAGFDCYTIPYNLNDYTVKGCFPVKFLDALSAGLPTVVTNLPSYASFSGFCYIAKNDEGFVELIERALEEDSTERVENRMKVARENSWDRKVGRMLEIVGVSCPC